MSVGSEIKKKRTELGMNRKEFRDALGMGIDGDRIIKMWEEGDLIPDDETLKQIQNFASCRPYSVEKPETQDTFRYIDLFAGFIYEDRVVQYIHEKRYSFVEEYFAFMS